MKKVLTAFDGLKYSTSTRDYALALAGFKKSYLAGVFLEDLTYTSYKVYELMAEGKVSEKHLNALDDKDQAIRDAAVFDFEKTCQKQGVPYSIHHDKNIAIQDLKHESVYADLLIIDSKETLTHYNEKIPTRFMRDLLSDVQCPVMVVPAKFRPIEKVILLYDGEPSSVHAIKMFSYVLYEFAGLETEIITVNPINTTLHLPDNKLMKEFLKRHYPKAKMLVKKGWAEEEIIKYLKAEQKNSLVVLGAYRRNTVSRWFRESMADTLMKQLKLPLFIAHNK